MNDHALAYCYRVGSATNVIGRPPRLMHSRELIPSGCRFASIYAVRREDALAIEQEAGTAASFRGTVWSRRLWVDFDHAEPARAAEGRLNELGLDYVVYTTGNRGSHIGILRDNAPSHVLPAQDKKWVQENLKGADTGIYWALHLLRLPGAIHEQTGMPKVELRSIRGKSLILPPIPPRESAVFGHQGARGGNVSVFKVWEVVSLLVPDKGQGRHAHLVKLVKALQVDARTDIDTARMVMIEVNKGFEEPKDLQEIENLLRWAYKGD